MSEPEKFPEMFEGIIAASSEEILTNDPSRGAIVMLISRWAAMSSDWSARRVNRLHVNGAKEWAQALSTALGRQVSAAELRAWESGTVAVPNKVLRTAVALVDMDADELLGWDQSYRQWARVASLVASHKPGFTNQKPTLQGLIKVTRSSDRAHWMAIVGDLREAIRQFKNAEMMIRATLAEADHLRFLAQIQPDDPIEEDEASSA